MNGVVAAALQFITNGGLAGAGKAFDQIIPPAHALENTRRGRPGRWVEPDTGASATEYGGLGQLARDAQRAAGRRRAEKAIARSKRVSRRRGNTRAAAIGRGSCP